MFFIAQVLSCLYLQCEECPPAGEGSGGWNSQLMVCNIGSRNATLMWNQDTAASNTTYEVVYQDIDDRGNPIRSEPVSYEFCQCNHTLYRHCLLRQLGLAIA